MPSQRYHPDAWAREAEQSLKRSRERRAQVRKMRALWPRAIAIALVCAIIAICVLLALHWPS